MRMPGFTADIALSRSRKRYSLAVARSPLVGGETVIPAAPPQFDESFWDWWVAQTTTCLPPLCGRDAYGRCHCLAVKFYGPD